MYEHPETVDEVLGLHDDPVIGVDEYGIITFINDSFTEVYGWTQQDLVGKSLTLIMPEKFREAHEFGFSRFLATEQARITAKELPLEITSKDGTAQLAEHYILADKKDGHWRFGATIILREG